jgi:hypothetical protein
MSSEPLDNAAVDRAINRILVAEREGQAAVEECRKQAAALVAAAQARAERIAEATERRIQWVHHIADDRLDATLRGLTGTALAIDGRQAAPSSATLAPAIAQLVDEMVGRLP